MPHGDNSLEPKNKPMNPDGTLANELPPRDAHKQGLHRTMTLGGQYPRHTKQYRNLFKMEQALQVERIEGFRDYISDVQGGRFPGPEHIVKAPDGLIDQFLDAVEGKQPSK